MKDDMCKTRTCSATRLQQKQTSLILCIYMERERENIFHIQYENYTHQDFIPPNPPPTSYMAAREAGEGS